MLRKIFGPKRDKVAEELRRLRNEELYDLHSSPNMTQVIKSMRMRWTGHVVHVYMCTCRVLVEKPEGKRPLGRPMHRWEDNIKMNLKKSGMVGLGLDQSGSG